MIIRERLMAFLLTQLFWEFLRRMLNQQFGWLITYCKICTFLCAYAVHIWLYCIFSFCAAIVLKVKMRVLGKRIKERHYEGRQSSWTLSIDSCREGKMWSIVRSWAKGHFTVYTFFFSLLNSIFSFCDCVQSWIVSAWIFVYEHCVKLLIWDHLVSDEKHHSGKIRASSLPTLSQLFVNKAPHKDYVIKSCQDTAKVPPNTKWACYCFEYNFCVYSATWSQCHKRLDLKNRTIQIRPDQYFFHPLGPLMCSTVHHSKLAKGHSRKWCKEAKFTLTGGF